MVSFSKDPETGKPNWVSADKEEDVSLVTTADAMYPDNKARGVSTPGWVYYSEHVRADGHTARRIDTLVSFRKVGDAIGTLTAELSGDITAGVEFTITFSEEPDSVEATLNGSTYSGGTLVGAVYTATLSDAGDIFAIEAKLDGFLDYVGEWEVAEA